MCSQIVCVHVGLETEGECIKLDGIWPHKIKQFFVGQPGGALCTSLHCCTCTIKLSKSPVCLAKMSAHQTVHLDLDYSLGCH